MAVTNYQTNALPIRSIGFPFLLFFFLFLQIVEFSLFLAHRRRGRRFTLRRVSGRCIVPTVTMRNRHWRFFRFVSLRYSRPVAILCAPMFNPRRFTYPPCCVLRTPWHGFAFTVFPNTRWAPGISPPRFVRDSLAAFFGFPLPETTVSFFFFAAASCSIFHLNNRFRTAFTRITAASPVGMCLSKFAVFFFILLFRFYGFSPLRKVLWFGLASSLDVHFPAHKVANYHTHWG